MSQENRYRRQKADNTPSLALPHLTALFFRMITAPNISPHQKTPLATLNIRRHPQKIIAPSQKSQPQPQNADRHLPQNVNTCPPPSNVHPKTRICVQNHRHAGTKPNTCSIKTPPHHHKSRLFRRNALFCLHNRKTQHRVQHRTQNQSEKHELCRPVLTPHSPPTHRFRYAHTKKCNTPMPDRNNKITGFSADPLQVFN